MHHVGRALLSLSGNSSSITMESNNMQYCYNGFLLTYYNTWRPVRLKFEGRNGFNQVVSDLCSPCMHCIFHRVKTCSLIKVIEKMEDSKGAGGIKLNQLSLQQLEQLKNQVEDVCLY